MTLGFLPEASAEFYEATEYYESKQEGLGWRFRREVIEVCCLIVQRDDNGELFDVAGAIANAWRDLGGET